MLSIFFKFKFWKVQTFLAETINQKVCITNLMFSSRKQRNTYLKTTTKAKNTFLEENWIQRWHFKEFLTWNYYQHILTFYETMHYNNNLHKLTLYNNFAKHVRKYISQSVQYASWSNTLWQRYRSNIEVKKLKYPIALLYLSKWDWGKITTRCFI